MAYFVRRGPERIEIRESHATPRGPRARVLASFREPLTRDVAERAAARARRPCDAAALLRKARAAGIRVAARSREPEARALLARLRRPDPLDPTLAEALRAALDRQPDAAARAGPESLAEAAEWLGASPAERGAALRDLLDLYGTVAASRTLPRERARRPFPRFSSARRAG